MSGAYVNIISGKISHHFKVVKNSGQMISIFEESKREHKDTQSTPEESHAPFSVPFEFIKGKFAVITDIRKAIKDEKIETYIQFLVSAQDKKEVGGELLARWNHGRLGMLKPSLFVEVLESKEMMHDFDCYMIEKACQVLEDWSGLGAKMFLSCNVSRHTAEREDFPEFVKGLTEKYKFEGTRLILELTEYSKEKNRARLVENMIAINELGVGFYLDDYGSGITSVLDWIDFPLEAVKFDYSLTNSIFKEKGAIAVKNLVDSCHELGYKTVFEGIEEARGVEIVAGMNGDIIQGFYFHKPIPTNLATMHLRDMR